MSANKAVAIGFAISMTMGSAILVALRLVLDANGQVMALAMIVLTAIASMSLSEIDHRFSSKNRR